MLKKLEKTTIEHLEFAQEYGYEGFTLDFKEVLSEINEVKRTTIFKTIEMMLKLDTLENVEYILEDSLHDMKMKFNANLKE